MRLLSGRAIALAFVASFVVYLLPAIPIHGGAVPVVLIVPFIGDGDLVSIFLALQVGVFVLFYGLLRRRNWSRSLKVLIAIGALLVITNETYSAFFSAQNNAALVKSRIWHRLRGE